MDIRLRCRRLRSGAMLIRTIALVASLLALAACAAPSHVDPKAIAVMAPLTEQESIALLTKISSQFQQSPFIGGNKVELLRDGPATFAAMTAAIKSATRRIDMESYQFDT